VNHAQRSSFVVLFLAVGVVLGGAQTACKSEKIPERQPVVYEDFGTEVTRILHWEMRYAEHDPAAKMAVVAENRDDLIWALNRMVDEPVYSGLQPALESILPHYDTALTDVVCIDDSQCGGTHAFCHPEAGVCAEWGKLPRITRRIQDLLTRMGSPQFDALAKLAASHGAPPDAFNRLIYRLLTFDQELFGPMHRLITEQEPRLTEILRWAHRKILELEDTAPPVHPTFAEKLLQVVDSDLDTGDPSWAVVLDDNGNPVVNYEGGVPYDPYVDGNGDGVVDVDWEGDPVDGVGQKIVMPVFSDTPYGGESRDGDGLAQMPSEPLFAYFDVKKSLLGMMLWNLHPMVGDGVVWDLFTAFEGLLGLKTTRTDADGTYPGFDAAQNPLLDMMHALREVRRYPRLPQLMACLKALVQQHPQLVGELLTELGKTMALFEGPARLTPGNTLFDELHVELEYLARTGLLAEMLSAFDDPRMDGLSDGLYNLMAYTDIQLGDPDVELECGSVAECQQRLAQIKTLPFGAPTPWNLPDTVEANKSIGQKFLSLVWDVYEVEYTINLFNGLPLSFMQITDDMATYYVQSMAGTAVLEAPGLPGSMVVPFIDEFEDEYPSAEEFGLFMNHHHGFLGNAVCKQGFEVKDHHGRMLLAYDRTGALEAMKPLAEAFANLNDEHAFARLFSVLHFHYSSLIIDDPNGYTTQHGTNLRALEEPLARMASETQFLDKTTELVRAMNQMSVIHGAETLSPTDELVGLVAYLLDSGAGVSTYTGEPVYAGDGVTTIPNPSRLQLLLHAFDKMDVQLAASVPAKEAWDRMELTGYLLDVDAAGNLVNPTTVPMVVNLVPILADEIAVRFGEPTYSQDLDREIEDLAEFFESRGFSYIYEIMILVRDDSRYADLKLVTDDLLYQITDASVGGDQDLFGAVLAVLSDVFQSRIDCNAGKQLLRWFGEVIEPDDRILIELVELMHYLYEADSSRIFVELGKNLFREQRPGHFAINVLGRVIKAIHRVDPSARDSYTEQDFEHIVTGLADYLVDEERGLERMYTIISDRD
jgi:hypothetical protein